MKGAGIGRVIKIGGVVVAQTPLPLPSFSSFALDESDLSSTIEHINAIVFGPVLVSAFDLYFSRLSFSERVLLNSPLTFSDSGGYENLRVSEVSEQQINLAQHREVLARWPQDRNVLIVNFDKPSDDLAEQIDAALAIRPGERVGRELLLKPSVRVDILGLIKQIGANIFNLGKLDVIGLTEKEAGATLVEQLSAISMLRGELDIFGLEDTPIHVFGGLDPRRTPLYFLAGADIFDGLTWLRYGFEHGDATYLKACASTNHPDIALSTAEWRTRKSNFIEITQMQTAMRKFIASGDPEELHRDGPSYVNLIRRVRDIVSERQSGFR